MTRFRTPLAFFSGLALYAIMIVVCGYLAAVVIPKAYFDLFSRAHLGLALNLQNAAVITLPCFLLALAWSWLTLRLLTA
ncbi:MAG: hypothetical protein M3N23_00080, partial [Pseudomonadota bacterium]|nr:hypothetical protein [Pseudomonadota bacterium]